jgi:hypothetical protein
MYDTHPETLLATNIQILKNNYVILQTFWPEAMTWTQAARRQQVQVCPETP